MGDTARAPYPAKSSDAVISYLLENTRFLIDRGAKIVVIACDTASRVAVDAIRKEFGIPVFECITPAVNLALEASKKKILGVIGTRETIKSNVYEQKIVQANPGARVISAACPMLVPLIEEGWFKRPETRMIVKKYLHPLKVRQIDALILGCTHYPMLKDIIQVKIGKRVVIIDPAEGAADDVQRFLKDHPEIDNSLGRNGKHEIFVSNITEQSQKAAKTMLRRKVVLRQVNSNE